MREAVLAFRRAFLKLGTTFPIPFPLQINSLKRATKNFKILLRTWRFCFNFRNWELFGLRLFYSSLVKRDKSSDSALI